MGILISTNTTLRAHRIERYAELRFGSEESKRLADAVDHVGRPVDWHDVAKVLTRGCDHKTALRIFT